MHCQDFSKKSNCFIYRCANRCGYCIKIPLDEFNTETKSFPNLEYIRVQYEQNPHLCTADEKAKEVEKIENIVEIKHDLKVLEEYIRNNPLQSPSIIKSKLLAKNNQDFKMNEVKKMLGDIRNELFPQDNNIVFSAKYCKTKEILKGEDNMYKGRVNLPLANETKFFQEFVVLASDFQLNLLSKSTS